MILHSIHSKTGFHTETTTTWWCNSRTLFSDSSHSKTEYRTETTIQNRNSQHWCNTPCHNANVELCFCIQHIAKQVSGPKQKKQPESKQPASIEATHYTIMQKWNTTLAFNTQLEDRTSHGRIETTSQIRNNQPTLRQHITPWCESGALLSHSTRRKAVERKQPTRIETNSHNWGNAHQNEKSNTEYPHIAAQALMLLLSIHSKTCFPIETTTTSWFGSRTLFSDSPHSNTESKQPSRIETTNIDVTHCAMMQMSIYAFAFCTQQNRFQDRNKNKQPESNQPACVETTHYTMMWKWDTTFAFNTQQTAESIQSALYWLSLDTFGFSTKQYETTTTSWCGSRTLLSVSQQTRLQYRNNQPKSKQPASIGAWCESWTLLLHTTKQQNRNSKPESKQLASIKAAYNIIMQSRTFSIRILLCIG